MNNLNLNYAFNIYFKRKDNPEDQEHNLTYLVTATPLIQIAPVIPGTTEDERAT